MPEPVPLNVIQRAIDPRYLVKYLDKTLLADLPNLTDPSDMNPIIAVEHRFIGD